MASLAERLQSIRSSPRLQSQQQTAVVLHAIDDTLLAQQSEATPAAYFAALLALLAQTLDADQHSVNSELSGAIVYLLDLVAHHVAPPLLRSKFSHILSSLTPVLAHPEAAAPILRASIGCLESLLIAQDASAWALPQSPSSPRGAVVILLSLAMDHRPKVRKRALDALGAVLRHPPSSPSLDHPAAEMCAEAALRQLQGEANDAGSTKRKRSGLNDTQYEPYIMHALQLSKVVASAHHGWPSRKIDALCEILLSIARGSHEFLTAATFEIFELVFAGMSGQTSSSKLPRVLQVLQELQPSQSDSQMLPPWIAVLSRGYAVASQVEPQQTFEQLPELFSKIASFLSSSSHNIRVSASQCLNSLLHTGIPESVLLEPSIMDEKVLEKIANTLRSLLNVKFQGAWMEVFDVVTNAFGALRWLSHPLLDGIVKTIGDLRGDDSFAGKKEADIVLAAAIRHAGPASVLAILPLNLEQNSSGPGRAWLLPLMRDSVSNTNLAHFRSHLVPVSEVMFQRVLDQAAAEKSMETKIFETIVSQTWSCFPGYCELPLDLPLAFDQPFAELLSNLLYQQPQLRTDVCKGLQNLVDTNRAIVELGEDVSHIQQGRLTKSQAQANIEHLAGFSNNLLAVLFNVYSQTLPQNRGNLLECINAYLSIAPAAELLETFERVSVMLERSLSEQESQTQAQKHTEQPAQKNSREKMPPVSHTLMDLVITMSTYLPRDSFTRLFNMAANIVNRTDNPQLQKKAYKLVPRLSLSETGRQALAERNTELQSLILSSADKTSAAARRDRLCSIAEIIPGMSASDLHFVPSIISEAVIGVKEVNEKARTAAFDLLVLMGEKMAQGGTVVNAKVSHMPSDAPSVSASLEEYFTMVSAGLAGSTPHMISASITALTRLLYEFHGSLQENTVVNLVQTMDLFLTSKNREVVRSVLGFVKVCVTSLSSALVLPRLESLVPNLLSWSHVHKQHFRAKVKHILERMIRRFGADIIERLTPESDRKLIVNIRKTRERRKKKQETGDDDNQATMTKRRGKFDSEYDEAVYGSASEDSASEATDDDDLEVTGKQGRTLNKQYIVEEDDEPLDLLDQKALARVSSTRPEKNRQSKPIKAKTDLDGKLVFNEDSDNELLDSAGEDAVDDETLEAGTLEEGINAYVDAIRGKHVAQRGQRGKLKYKNARGEEDEMDIDDGGDMAARKLKQKVGQATKSKPQRRGLGVMGRVRDGRVSGGKKAVKSRPSRPARKGHERR